MEYKRGTETNTPTPAGAAVPARPDQALASLERVDAAREREHRELASELHRELVGSLSAIKMQCDWLLRAEQNTPQARERLASMSASLGGAIGFTRQVIDRLWPSMVGHLGLAVAVQQRVADFAARGAMELHAAVDAAVDDIPESHAMALYLIVQHALDSCAQAPSGAARLALRRTERGVQLELDARPRMQWADADGLLLLQRRMSRLGGELSTSTVREETHVRAFLPVAG
jgi:two-component system, NarL family, sensor histidine kinase UhpB